MNLVQVDVIGVEPAKTGLDLGYDVTPRVTRIIRSFVHATGNFGGEDSLIALALQRLANIFL